MVMMAFALFVIIVVVMALTLFIIVVMMVVMMLVLFFLFVLIFIFAQVCRETVSGSGHGIEDDLAVELIPRCGDDAGFRVQFPDDGHIRFQLGRIDVLGPGQDDTGRCCDLIIEELLEVLVVDLAAGSVHNRAVAVDFQAFHRADCPQDVGELADTGRFNQDPVRMIGLNDLVQGSLKVTLQCAADAAAVDFVDLDAGFLQETAVNADFAEFVFYQDNLFTLEDILQQFGNQSCFSGAEKSGNYIYFCHVFNLLSVILQLHYTTAVNINKEFAHTV